MIIIKLIHFILYISVIEKNPFIFFIIMIFHPLNKNIYREHPPIVWMVEI